MENKLKKYGLDKIVLIVLAGILLLLITIPWKKEGSTLSDKASSESSTEQRVISILEKRYGEGNIDVMITESKESSTYFDDKNNKTVTGVLVMVRTNDIANASYDIVNIITALFDVPAHKVVVLNMR